MICIYGDIQEEQSGVYHLLYFSSIFYIQVNWVPGLSVKITGSDRYMTRTAPSVPFCML